LLLAPVFPVAFAWMDQALPEARGRASTALLGSLVGGLIFPVLVGRAIGANTPNVLPLALAAIAAVCLVVCLSLPRLIDHRAPATGT
jgi:MFS transporter, FHS family, glucose/mannose:H+ symporter